VFNFGKIMISSDFCSGNLSRAEEGDEEGCVSLIYLTISQYNLWISTDSLPYFKFCGFRTWFYFGVKGTEKDEVLRFTIKNMNHQSRLYASGLRPVMRLGKQGKWKRQQGKISWIVR